MPTAIASLHPADALAIAMLLVLLFAFGTVFLILRSIFIHHRKPETEIDRLLREVAEISSSPASHSPPPPAQPRPQPWERGADDWRQS